jgi:serine/threonine-protein kinase
MRQALTAAEWAELKSRWHEVEESSDIDRRRVLSDTALSVAVRRELERMLAVRADEADSLERSSRAARGFVLSRTTPTGSSAADSAESPTLVGQRIGPFLVKRFVARGGMGAVYEAERADHAFAQRVAIKTLWRGADSDELLQRFRAERQILAGLQHPNISQLVDGGATAEGTPWLAMEFVDGEPIDAWCDARRLDLPARLDLFRQVCAAVHHAHQRLVVHRDLKPGNVFVNADGTVKLLDFGVAKLVAGATVDGYRTQTDAGLSPLTAAYAAPEQVGGDEVSTATDVFALGALLCTLLSGAPPHDLTGLDSVERLLRVRDGLPRMPSDIAAQQPATVAAARGFESPHRLADAIRGELEAIVQMALRREPARRYASAEAFADDVRRYLRRDRVLARPDTTRYRLWTFVRRHRAFTLAACTVLVTLLGAAAITLRQATRIRVEAQRAERAAAFLSGMVSGTNATSSDPLVRLPPQGTLAQLLDSALLRVPRVFADDASIRARLYTAIGANLASQGRLTRARAVLDSARQLAVSTDGTISAAAARANLEYATLVIELDGPWAADDPLRTVEAWTVRGRDEADLATRLLLVRASQAQARGEMRRADSLASAIIEQERRSAVRSSLSVRAEAIRMAASSWLRRDPRDYLRRAREVMALADSLGFAYSNEQVRAQAAEIEALLVLGRAGPAGDVAQRWQDNLRANMSLADGVEAAIAQLQGFVAAVRGDSAARHDNAVRAWRIAQRSPDIPMSSRVLIANSAIDDALARGDVIWARAAADSSVFRLQGTRSPLVLSFAQLYAGSARLAAGDAVAAEASLRAGLAQVAMAPDLASMGPRLRRPLAEALRRQKRTAEADSVARLDPPRASVPKCTPGGDWRGCPDTD